MEKKKKTYVSEAGTRKGLHQRINGTLLKRQHLHFITFNKQCNLQNVYYCKTVHNLYRTLQLEGCFHNVHDVMEMILFRRADPMYLLVPDSS